MASTSIQDENIDDTEGNRSMNSVDAFDTELSTKRPSTEGKQSTSTKRKKREAQEEDSLLQMAIQCLEKSASNIEDKVTRKEDKEDEDDIFGKYVASELRSMELSVKRLAKWKIQSVIFNAHSGSLQASEGPADLWSFEALILLSYKWYYYTLLALQIATSNGVQV